MGAGTEYLMPDGQNRRPHALSTQTGFQSSSFESSTPSPSPASHARRDRRPIRRFGHAPPCSRTRAPRKRLAGAMIRTPGDASLEARGVKASSAGEVYPAADEPFFVLGLERLLGPGGRRAPYRTAGATSDAAGVRACRRTSSASSTKRKESSRRSSSG